VSREDTGALADFGWLLESMTPGLWIVAIVFFGVGDLTTTALGLSTGALVEASPLAAPILGQLGLSALVVLKMLGFAVSYIAWREVPNPVATCVPLWLSSLGVILTGWNISLILIVY